MQNQPHTNTCSEITAACYFNTPCVRVFPARFEMDFKETAFPSNTYGRKTALSDNVQTRTRTIKMLGFLIYEFFLFSYFESKSIFKVKSQQYTIVSIVLHSFFNLMDKHRLMSEEMQNLIMLVDLQWARIVHIVHPSITTTIIMFESLCHLMLI